MAKTSSRKELMKSLRAGGLRKRVARSVSKAAGSKRTSGSGLPKPARKAVKDLRAVIEEIERRAAAPGRSEAARKAARTRKRKAAARSASAKKGARTRARP